MINEQLKRRLYNSATSLINKYDMFLTNKQYSSQHFKSEDEYVSIQKALAAEIQLEETTCKNHIIKYFAENFPSVTVVLFDSRPICLSDSNHRLGKILVKGVKDDLYGIKEINKAFINDTDMSLIIDKWEDLDSESQQKLTEFLHNAR